MAQRPTSGDGGSKSAPGIRHCVIAEQVFDMQIYFHLVSCNTKEIKTNCVIFLTRINSKNKERFFPVESKFSFYEFSPSPTLASPRSPPPWTSFKIKKKSFFHFPIPSANINTREKRKENRGKETFVSHLLN